MRKCGTCSACCRWPSVAEIDKPARVPCQHLHKQGYRCTIYEDRPRACGSQEIIDDLAKGPVRLGKMPTSHEAIADRILGQMGLSHGR